jgi:hypothetical protein
MASPSKQENAPEQNPSTIVNSVHPDPASSPQSDSIDALFHTEKADAVEDSLTSGRGKRATNDTPQAQRRRSTRNP